MNYVRLGIWTAFLSVPLFFLLPVLQVQRHSGHYIIFQIFQVVLILFGSIVFVVLLKEGVWGKLLGDFIAGASIFLIVCLYIGFKKLFRFSFHWKYIKDSLKFGIPIVPHLLSTWIFNLSNRLILKHFYPMSEVGIYSVGHNIGMIMLILTISFNNAWAPFMFDQANNSPNAKQIFSKLTTYYVIVLCGIALLLSAMSRWIVMVMTTHGYGQAAGVAEIVVASYAIYGLYFMLTNQIWYSKKTGYLPIITGTTALLSIGVNFFLIPKWGMLGASYSLMISSCLIVFLTYIFSSKVYPVTYQKGAIGLCFLFGAVIFIVNRWITLSNIWADLIVKWGIVLIYPLLVWKLGLLAKEEKEKVIQFLSRYLLIRKRISFSEK
jgi:O-antigen/teichoic acid export membrane protein